MTIVLDGNIINEFMGFFMNDPKRLPCSESIDRINQWFGRDHGFYHRCIKPMLAMEKGARPTALEVLKSLRSCFSEPPVCRCACLQQHGTRGFEDTTDEALRPAPNMEEQHS